MTTFDFQRTYVDFSSKTHAQGPILPNSESWGTDSANSAQFAPFSPVFKPFVPETYKNTIQGYLQYYLVYLGVLTVSAI